MYIVWWVYSIVWCLYYEMKSTWSYNNSTNQIILFLFFRCAFLSTKTTLRKIYGTTSIFFYNTVPMLSSTAPLSLRSNQLNSVCAQERARHVADGPSSDFRYLQCIIINLFEKNAFFLPNQKFLTKFIK